jgi:hypothetical protein
MSVVNNIRQSCDDLGHVDLSGISLEDALPQLLDVSEMTLDEHVSMQPAAIAYYGSLLKETERRLKDHERAFERWEKIEMAKARASMTGKVVIDEVRARFLIDNENELNVWYKKKEDVQADYDSLYVWYQAWKQKAHSIREYISLTEDERWNTSSSVKGKSGDNRSKSRGASRAKELKEKLQKINKNKQG